MGARSLRARGLARRARRLHGATRRLSRAARGGATPGRGMRSPRPLGPLGRTTGCPRRFTTAGSQALKAA
eukprot:13618970-Alexandrium_andersonii.AAC.1